MKKGSYVFILQDPDLATLPKSKVDYQNSFW